MRYQVRVEVGGDIGDISPILTLIRIIQYLPPIPTLKGQGIFWRNLSFFFNISPPPPPISPISLHTPTLLGGDIGEIVFLQYLHP